jgi:hypothetical protein
MKDYKTKNFSGCIFLNFFLHPNGLERTQTVSTPLYNHLPLVKTDLCSAGSFYVSFGINIFRCKISFLNTSFLNDYIIIRDLLGLLKLLATFLKGIVGNIPFEKNSRKKAEGGQGL